MADRPGLFETLRVIVQTLERLDARYMLVGGVALAAWSPPRATTDIDLVLGLPESDMPAAAKLIARRVGGVASARPQRFRSGITVHRLLAQRAGEVVVDLLTSSVESGQGSKL